MYVRRVSNPRESFFVLTLPLQMILKGELTALTLFVVFVAASDDTSDEFKSDSKDLSKKIENLRVEGSEYLQKVMRKYQNFCVCVNCTCETI